MKLVLASGNLGKCDEINTALNDLPLEIVLQTDLNVSSVEETGGTFVENAIIKARHASKITGLPSIADDSGLEVLALNGAPGIYSARYAGLEADFDLNIDKLLTELSNVENMQRAARFVCVLVFMRNEKDPTPGIFYGFWDGLIHQQKSGKNGFGYDPVFYLPKYQLTAAELDFRLKQTISHRAKAMVNLKRFLRENVLNNIIKGSF